MLKPKKIDVNDSNIAKLGSKEEKDARVNAAKSEVEFKGAGDEVGLQIWRVEKLAIKAIPKETYGTFYSGDSYIVLCTYKKELAKAYNAHFWLGKDTSQDEAGVAAYKTVELDDVLGGTPVQYREVQGHESDLFLGYFNNKITLLDGGIDSGFNHVKPDQYKPRLLHIKGKKQIRVMQVALARESLNNGDTFILDNGLKIWQWNGAKANIPEKNKANQIVIQLKAERAKAHSKILDGDEDDEEFWKLLGGKGAISDDAGDDEEVKAFEAQLYRLSDASGSMKFSLEGKGALKKAALDSNDVFIVDVGHTVFVWVGSKATADERKKAMNYASDYLSKQGRPGYTPVTRIIDGGETDAFLKCFHE